ncbi:hypothetical protein WJX74_001421 [Apatococcus lobatus]|uniref:Ankyrin repeat domain-containing protein n=1 Tax=Apatococcus lobatus TaxID=904363 RepID=A0AAW1RS77_9CHLO
MQWQEVMPAEWGPWLNQTLIGSNTKEAGGISAKTGAVDAHGSDSSQPVTNKEVQKVALAAAADGRLDILQWLVARQGCSFEEEVAEVAVQGNHLDVVKWLRQLDPPCELPVLISPIAAASQADAAMLQYLSTQDRAWTAKTTAAAAMAARWELVMWLVSQGCELDRTISLAAAKQGRVDMLEWLVEEGLNILWGPMLCQAACVTRQLPALQWLRRHGCPGYLDVACKTASCNLDVPMLDWLAGSQFMESEDALECCCGAIKHMGEQPSWISDPQAKCKEVLQWFLDRRQHIFDPDQFEIQLCLKAAMHNHLGILKWLREVGPEEHCVWDNLVFTAAAAYGDLEMLRWMLGQQCTLDEEDPPEIPGDCTDSRLMCLARAGWDTCNVLHKLQAVQRKHVAFYGAARWQGKHMPGQTSLASLPSEVLLQIACEAGIDFDWRFSGNLEDASKANEGPRPTGRLPRFHHMSAGAFSMVGTP